MFETPIALAGLIGLIVPLLIHLWERQKGRRVLVGSIRWLEGSEERRVSRLKFSDLLRFLLRGLIVTLFVFLVADPVWHPTETGPEKRHWVLVEPSLSTNISLQGIFDSLRSDGRPVRLLTPGFPEWTPDSEGQAPDTTVNYWSLLRELSRLPAAPDTVTIFAHPFLKRFDGERPELPIVIQWPSLPESTEKSFLVRAWRKGDDLDLLLELTGPFGHTYQRLTVPAAAGRQDLPDPFPPLLVRRGSEPEAWQVQLAGTDQKPLIATDPSPLFVRIYYDRNWVTDQNYLRAALRAVETYTGRTITMKWLPADRFDPAAGEASENNGWLFWLSERPVPSEAAAIFRHQIVYYDPGDLFAESYFSPENGRVRLFRRFVGEGNIGEIEERLPIELLNLLFRVTPAAASARDLRYMDRSQLQPGYATDEKRKDGPSSTKRSLHLPLWLLLTGLFLAERVTAGKTFS